MSTDTTVLTAPVESPVGTDLGWMTPDRAPQPAEALDRIRQLCELGGDDLYRTMLMVLASHQAVPREILAAAVKQFRRDTDSLTREDVTGLFNALWTGGHQGFHSVLRTRKGGERKPANLGWLKTDD
ncbi:hypothetical protein KGA65_15820 [Ideonella sp. B7]|uniref:hypothetical protein n=1 Tax=Ideonella benzenivorans TaxID=2831643 RepID=UPI001CEC454F|nr:hypothetical protein [Ideonella benzenivorans]MCA6218002.1 hypothetical protein [Ideonella benzenivorans]